MPINPKSKGDYPSNWKEISQFVRFTRAGGKCEWPGCEARHGEPNPKTGSKVVLTVAHLNHTPADCRLENLRALCQRHHLVYDQGLHALNRARKRYGDELATQYAPPLILLTTPKVEQL